DPFLGGTHLPDVTVIAPVFIDSHLLGFVANRAHHADIGAESPGSMPLSRSLAEEGLVIEPVHVVRESRIDQERLDAITAHSRNRRDAEGDFAAQIGANRRGLMRLQELVAGTRVARYRRALQALNDYGERLARAGLADLPPGRYAFEDLMDDDGLGRCDIVIRASIEVGEDTVSVDFDGTAEQVPGNVNCPLSVTAAAVYYAFRCLMPPETPACAGSFRPISLQAPEGCLVNARRPAAVAAGNVETSTRIVDVVLGALAEAAPGRVGAASHGSMNNVAIGVSGAGAWGYYETIGGGMGAGPEGGALDAVQTHMTNTRNTPIEVLEMRHPLRIVRYAIRRESGGRGRRAGGDGIVRTYEFLEPARFTLLTERRRHAPWGLAGGGPGLAGRNRLNDHELPAKVAAQAEAGDRLSIETAGGGGWGL
ncbi:MAG: hydantoinase B/oxoprolinase family protein, partial [Chromatiales bacterium]